MALLEDMGWGRPQFPCAVGKCLLGLMLLAFPAQASNPTRCLRALRFVQGNGLADLRKYVSLSVDGADNPTFIHAKNQGQKPNLIFVHVDNSVFKDLRDEFFQDAELAAGASSLFRQIFVEILAHELKGSAPRLVYADYKGLRLGFEGERSQVRSLIERVSEETAVQFDFVIKESFPALKPLYASGYPRVAHPNAWHQGGLGRTPGLASTVSRYRRLLYDLKQATVVIQDFDDPDIQKGLNERVEEIERYRTMTQVVLERKNGVHTRALVSADREKKVLSEEAIEIMRRVLSLRRDDFISPAITLFRNDFGVELTPSDVILMRDYLELVDTFMPSIDELSEVSDLGLRGAKHGLVVFDMAGQNVRNTHQAALALARSVNLMAAGEAAPLSEIAVAEAERGQTIASGEFDIRREMVRKSIFTLGLPGEIGSDHVVRFSGDDSVFSPGRALLLDEKIRLVELVSESGRPSDFRLTFLPSKYSDSSTVIPESDRSRLVTLSEGVEKNLRLELRLAGVPAKELAGFTLGIRTRPHSNGEVKIDLIVGGKATPHTLELMSGLVLKCLPDRFQFGRVIPPPHKERSNRTSHLWTGRRFVATMPERKAAA